MGDERTSMLQIRAPRKWLHILDEVRHASGARAGDKRSSYIKELVELEAGLWRRSPYVCTRSSHFLLVDESGHFFYRVVEELKLNVALQFLPASVPMKEEKREYYFRHYRDQASPIDDALRNHWVVNNFAVHVGPFTTGRNELGSLRDERSDEAGSTSKSVLLAVGLPDGSAVTREAVVVLRDYAQYLGDELESRAEAPTTMARASSPFDRADFSIDIPTRDLEIIVVVARGLFRHTEHLRTPRLSFELRNRDNAAFDHVDLPWLGHTGLEKFGSSSLQARDGDSEYRESRSRIVNQFKFFRRRLRGLSEKQSDPSRREILQSAVLPEDFLFYRLRSSSTHIGLIFSVKWPKPSKVL